MSLFFREQTHALKVDSTFDLIRDIDVEARVRPVEPGGRKVVVKATFNGLSLESSTQRTTSGSVYSETRTQGVEFNVTGSLVPPHLRLKTRASWEESQQRAGNWRALWTMEREVDGDSAVGHSLEASSSSCNDGMYCRFVVARLRSRLLRAAALPWLSGEAVMGKTTITSDSAKVDVFSENGELLLGAEATADEERTRLDGSLNLAAAQLPPVEFKAERTGQLPLAGVRLVVFQKDSPSRSQVVVASAKVNEWNWANLKFGGEAQVSAPTVFPGQAVLKAEADLDGDEKRANVEVEAGKESIRAEAFIGNLSRTKKAALIVNSTMFKNLEATAEVDVDRAKAEGELAFGDVLKATASSRVAPTANGHDAEAALRITKRGEQYVLYSLSASYGLEASSTDFAVFMNLGNGRTFHSRGTVGLAEGSLTAKGELPIFSLGGARDLDIVVDYKVEENGGKGTVDQRGSRIFEIDWNERTGMILVELKSTPSPVVKSASVMLSGLGGHSNGPVLMSLQTDGDVKVTGTLDTGEAKELSIVASTWTSDLEARLLLAPEDSAGSGRFEGRFNYNDNVAEFSGEVNMRSMAKTKFEVNVDLPDAGIRSSKFVASNDFLAEKQVNELN